MYEGSLSTISNRQSWSECISVLDTDNNQPVDLSTATEIAVQIAPQQSAEYGGYGSQTRSGSSALLTATLSNGKVQHVQTGVFQFSFSKGDMRALVGGVYDVEIAIEKDGEVESLILGTVPIREGVVTL